jgi:branched-chain amino acid transport system ATP-binding protein
LLEVKDLNVRYQELRILQEVNVSVKDGELVSIIGSNGAGKTTLLKAIAGLLKVTTGKMLYNGMEITRLPPHERARLGIVSVPEGRRLFPYLTVTENLELGAYSPRARAKSKENMKFVFSLFQRLQERKGQQAITLSGGEQQMLAMGRGLMASPELMLLDEPSLGLSPILTGEIFDVIRKLRENGFTILLVEQNAIRALELSDRTYVLENGSISIQGASRELLSDDRVRKAYLGL